ncbi:MAG: sigma-70 family RNA polymerase sigma factor [Phycisphaerales bacterium]|nr:sigma-70 family RNA polymerase sigma factor [Phycisphaerales bacterium]
MSVRRRAPDGHDIFEILVRENADMLTAYLRSALDQASDVDDLFQETMVVAWRRLDDYDRSRPFGPWLRGIARHLVLAHARKSARGPSWQSLDVLEAIDRKFETISNLTGETFRGRIDALLDCVLGLSERLRLVIELSYGRGMTSQEVALAINEREDTVRKRAQRARDRLHACLERKGTPE